MIQVVYDDGGIFDDDSGLLIGTRASENEKLCVTHKLALALMTNHGLVEKGWVFQFNRAKNRAGVCYYPFKDRPGRIGLSVHFVMRNSPTEIVDTILHEIAHALAGPGNSHNWVWRLKCREIGARPERCYRTSEVDMPKGGWQTSCPSCGKTYYRHRRPKKLTGWKCRYCGPIKGQLIWQHR